MAADDVLLSGPLPTKLGNTVSDAIYAAIQSGMECDEAVCVVLKVAIDYGVQGYGQQYIERLREAIPAMAAQ